VLHHLRRWAPLAGLTLLPALLAAWAPGRPAHAGDQPPGPATLGTVERKDPRLDRLIPPGAVIEKLADGFDWAEGPVWFPDEGGYLLFSDIPKNAIWKWTPGRGVSLFLKPAGYTGSAPRGGEPGSNGLARDAEGRLVLCEHGDRRVARREKDGKKVTLAGRYQGKRLNSPNDLVFRPNGDLYFTDPPYGLEKGWDDPARELDFCGVYRLTPRGELTLLTKELSRPNGIGFSPDGRTLYVANSDPKRAVWMAFPVKADGTLGPGRVFADVTAQVGKKPGLPDGLKVDRAGHLFATGPGGVLVFAPDATLLGVLATGVPTANCAFGDDGSTLYITADKNLARVRTTTKGL
jgi:gluconolactonase